MNFWFVSNYMIGIEVYSRLLYECGFTYAVAVSREYPDTEESLSSPPLIILWIGADVMHHTHTHAHF